MQDIYGNLTRRFAKHEVVRSWKEVIYRTAQDGWLFEPRAAPESRKFER